MIRLAPLALAACLALALAAPVQAGAPEAVAARHTCKTTFSSTSIFKRAKVVVIRGVTCKRALQVAKAYDNDSRTARGWHCGLAHNERTRLFSCGKGLARGRLQDAPHAFEAYGTGRKG